MQATSATLELDNDILIGCILYYNSSSIQILPPRILNIRISIKGVNH